MRHASIMVLIAVLAAPFVVHAAGSTSAPSPARNAPSIDDSPHAIANLEFREAVFELYQQRYFSSITQLLDAIELPGAASGESDSKAFAADFLYKGGGPADISQLLIEGRPSNLLLSKDETDVVLADLYLALGLPKPADQLLRRLVNRRTAASKHSWLTLANYYYRRGSLNEAQQALARLRDLPSGELQTERDSLSGLVFLAQNRIADAVTALKAANGQAQGERGALDRYNLGLSLLSEGKVQEGSASVEQLNASAQATPGISALRDLADINLAYELLGQKQYDQAAAALQRAARSGPYFSYVQLGTGWTASLQGDKRKALESWLPLTEGDTSDAAVQEGLLAVPYAYYQLGDYDQALNYYRASIKRYEKELAQLDAARPSLTDGALIDALAASNPGNGEFDSQWRPQGLPTSPVIAYLLPALSDRRFQEALKNYRDIGLARDILVEAGSDVDASLGLLDAQRDIYARWQHYTQRGNKDVSPPALMMQIKKIREEVDKAEAAHDVLSFATAKQVKALFALKQAKDLLDKLKDYIADHDELQAKYDLYSGLMLWDLTQQYPARVAEAKQQLQELQDILNNATRSQQMLVRSSEQVKSAFAGQDSAFRALRAKQVPLLAYTKPLQDEQQKYLENKLVQSLDAGAQRLNNYLLQAQLGIAQTIDRIADASSNKDYAEAIAAYQAFLDKSGETPYRRDVMFRLAYLKIQQADSRDSEQSAAKNNNRSDALYGEAIATLVQLLKDYPKDPNNDRVLYNLAKAYEHRGETDALLDTLDRLARDYSRSAYFEEVQFRRGELLFSLGLPAQAAEAYNAIVTKGPDSPLYNMALYKLAWSHYKEGRYDTAVDSFLSLLDRKLSTEAADKNATDPNLSRGDEELVSDILRGTVLSLAQLNGVQSLTNYFAQHGARPYENRLYDTLAQLYLEQQRFEDAANVYRAFVAQHPNDPQAPSFDSKVLTAYETGGFIDLLQTAKEEFIDRYAPPADYWKNNPDAVRGETLGKVRAYLLELTRYAHAKAQHSKAAPDYRRAEHFYDMFLQSFPEDPLASEMHFLYGEILFEDRRYPDAVRQYEKVAYEYKDDKKGAEAAYAAAIALEKENGGADRQATQQQSLLALQRFAEAYPGDPRAPAALMKSAQEWFSLRDHPHAVAAAQQLLDMKPPVDATLRRNAWMILGHSYFEDKDYAKAEQGYQQALTLMPKNDDKRHDLEENLAAAVYKQGEQARADNDLRGAVQHFLRIADLTPSVDIAATAQYDAAAALLALEDWPAAIKVLERFRKRYPDNPLQKELAPKLAVAYQKTGDWRKAAAELEILSAQGESEALKRDAVWQSAELYLRAGQPQEAQRMFQTYVRRYPQPAPEAIEAEQRLADLYAQQKNVEQRHHWLQQIVDTDKRSGAERTERTRLLAGRAALVLADTRYEAFADIKLAHPLKKSLRLKKKAMEEALGAYRAAGEYGIADITTDATYRAAQIYSELGKSLMSSERPKGLSDLELEQYNVLLEEQAFPFEEQAIALHEANARRAAENVYDDWVKKSFTALSKLLPGRYAKTEKGEAYVDAIY